MKTPEQIAREVSGGHFDTYQDSAEEVGHPEGQPIVETWPRLRECIVDAIEIDRRQHDGTLHAATIDALQDRIDVDADVDEGYSYRKRAIAWIESNPDGFWEEFGGPLLDDIERKFWAPKCDECDESAENFWPQLTPPVQLCASCTHDAKRSGWEPGA